MVATPKKGPRLGGDSAHQKAMVGNLFASLIASGYLETTVTKAKFLRPIAEKLITKAVKGGVHNRRIVAAFVRDKDAVARLFDEIAPQYRTRPGGYLRIHKLGPRQGDNAPMARITFV